ncbi:hypothetical protein HCN44_003370 [Aphidius gifuensis]|uniref:Uncharacterized protein n=1 Tax=Aphidius gifuensis TaxID=684658 RepID=A0A835CVD9_APHGI|nr:hypothetical protein HCN44_003370 [Aphidius gifuensis]
MSKDQYAIVKWTAGADKNKYTVKIPIKHIKNFDYKRYENNEYDDEQPFPVEWHENGKEPAGRWEVFEARVIEMSVTKGPDDDKNTYFDNIDSDVEADHNGHPSCLTSTGNCYILHNDNNSDNMDNLDRLKMNRPLTMKNKIRNWASKNIDNLYSLAITKMLDILSSEGYTDLPSTARQLMGF